MDEEENIPMTINDAGGPNDTKTATETEAAQDQEKLESKRRKTSIFTVVVITLVLASFGLQGAAIGFNVQKILVIVSGALSIVVSGTAAAKQIIMQRLDTLRTVHNKIRLEVNRFMLENNKLTRNVDGLEDKVIKLQHLEQHLSRIAQQQESSASELVSLVKENRDILRQQKLLAKAELQEQLLATLLRTDRNGDLHLDDREANIFILRMKNYEGVEFDEDQIRDALVETKGSLPALLAIIREIAEDCCGEDEEEDLGGEHWEQEEGGHDTSMPPFRSSMRSSKSSKRLIKSDERKFMESFILKEGYSQSSNTLFGESHANLEERRKRGSFLGHVSKQSLMDGSDHSM